MNKRPYLDLKVAVLTTFALCLAEPTHSAPITWGPAIDTTDKSQLLEGPAVLALNGGTSNIAITEGGTSNASSYEFTAVNFSNVTFAPTGADTGDSVRARNNDNIYSGDFIASTGDTNFDNLVASLTDSFGTPTGIATGTLEIDGLTPGTPYLVQVFFNDNRTCCHGRTMRYGDGNGNTVDVAAGDPAAGVQVDDYGQFAIGSFTADGTTQNLTMESQGFANVHFNAILVVAVAEDNLPLEIDSSGDDLVFRWNSRNGKLYDLLSVADPSTDPATWPVVVGAEGLAADPPTNTLTIARPADPARFYVVQERDIPPPPPAFEDDFESDQGWDKGTGGNHTGNTAWELGPPDTNFVDGPDTGANGSATCYGTDLDNNYEAGTEVWLRSPPINLTEATGATLTFWHIFDVDGSGDETGVVRVLRSSDNSVLGEVETFTLFDINLLDWSEFSEDLPAAALGETIRLEFQFTVDPGAVSFFPGWYIDDVMVTTQ